MKKIDLLLASAMVILALVWFLITLINKDEGQNVSVSLNNEIIDTHLLSENGEYTISYNDKLIMKYEIVDGFVNVTYADCRDQICVNQRKISKDKDVIVCLPNRIVIEIEGQAKSSKDDYDAVVY